MSKRRRRITFEKILRVITRAKVILVEIASLITLLIFLCHALKLEVKW